MTSVAHVTTIGDSLQYLLLNQLRAIHDAGYVVTGISAPGPVVTKLAAFGARHIAAPFVRATGLTPTSDAKLFATLVQIFRRERFTIVHTHTAKADLYAAAAARIAGVPVVITTLHGFYFHDEMPRAKRLFFSKLAKLGMRFCDAVLSQNPEDVVTAIRTGMCDASKIETLGNGIDVVRFDRARVGPDDEVRVRAELGIRPEQPVIGFVGRLVEEKGVRDLLTAAQIIRDRVPGVRLLLIGPIDHAKQDAISPTMAAKLGLEEMCIFPGHRDDLPILYSLMSVFTLPSHREGWPRTPMEASAMGLPIVVTNIRGCRSTVVDGCTGYLVPAGDPRALADRLVQLLEDAPTRRRMGEHARQHALEAFDERKVFSRVLATYDRLLRHA